MKFKQVLKFVKRANYGKDTMVFLGYEILEVLSDNNYCMEVDGLIEELESLEEDEVWCATIPLINGDTGEFDKCIICVGKEFHLYHKNKESQYKFVLLHEIGHINTYFEGALDTDENAAIWELESQLWAIKRAKEMGLNIVAKKAKDNLDNKWRDLGNPYTRAKEIYDLRQKISSN